MPNRKLMQRKAFSKKTWKERTLLRTVRALLFRRNGRLR